MLSASSNKSQPLAHPRVADDTRADLATLHVPPQEWRALITVNPNLLIEGPAEGAEKIIDAIATTVRCSVCEWGRPESDQKPAPILVVRRVDLFDDSDQRRLVEVLNAETSPVRQVITTSGQSLFALVEKGHFAETLYYRLNTIRLDLKEDA
jgi:hypothetical protein